MSTFRSSGILAVLAAFALAGCPSSPSPGRTCRSTGDCTEGRVCMDGRCVVDPTGDGSPPGVDGGTGTEDTGGGPRLDVGPAPIDAGLGDPMAPDEDMDGISDAHEGRDRSLDSDMDGVQDWRDIDSDGDGILDGEEAGDAEVATPPRDSDGDGISDFQDLDSDGNGVLDEIEGSGDVDGDGRANFRDLDNDGDGLLDAEEAGPDRMAPADSDGDGTADMNEPDSDADTISDGEEDVFDTDADGRLDRTDLDSDGDAWTDAQEAGDADLGTPAVDTDADGIADYRDPDSDDDGLSDAAERTSGTSRTSADSDSDGVSDLVEVGAGTDPLNPGDSPRTRGDFVFLEPYLMPPSPARDTLQFSTNLQRADVYFLMDNTGSMGGTIAGLQAGLTGTVIPDISTRIPEAWYGVGGFDDYPIVGGSIYGYGSGGCGVDGAGLTHDRPFFQYTTMTASVAAAQAGVNLYRTNCGADGPESGVHALYALATRDTLYGYASAAPGCPAGYRGAACFRPDAVPIVIVMTDVDQHNSPTCDPAFWGGGTCDYGGLPGGGHSYGSTIAALAAINARVVGIETSAYAHDFLVRLVTDTTIARGATGAASEYVYSAPSGSGLSTAITTLVQRAALVPLDVSARAVDLADAGETVDAVAAFVDHLETRTSPAPGLTCTTGFVTEDRAGIDADSFADTFNDVTPGSPVCFDIVPRMNTTVMPTLVPQIFRARIDVIGDGFTPLDDRVVYFLVPPRIPDPGS